MSNELPARGDTAPTAPRPPLKSARQQRAEMVQLVSRCRLTRTEYRLYRFDERGKDYEYMLNFLPVAAFKNEFRNAVNDPKWKPLLDNKWLYHLHYEQFGLALPECYGIYDPGAGFTRSGRPLGSTEDLRAFFLNVRPATLVIKPLGGIMGRKIIILSEINYDGDAISAVTNTGERMTFDGLAAKMNRPLRVRYYQSGGYELEQSGYLLESKLQQHAFLNAIAPYTTNTFRVVTFLNHAAEVDVHFTLLRLGRKGNVADNWDKGGIGVHVDETGVLGDGVLKPKYGGRWLQQHPDSGVRFTGEQVPHWDEVIALCKRAAKLTPKVRSIGWDVALTPAGPVLIEGNPDWDLAMVQVHSHGYLQPAVREELGHFGLTFPDATLPPLSLQKWYTYWRELRRRKAFYRRQ